MILTCEAPRRSSSRTALRTAFAPSAITANWSARNLQSGPRRFRAGALAALRRVNLPTLSRSRFLDQGPGDGRFRRMPATQATPCKLWAAMSKLACGWQVEGQRNRSWPCPLHSSTGAPSFAFFAKGGMIRSHPSTAHAKQTCSLGDLGFSAQMDPGQNTQVSKARPGILSPNLVPRKQAFAGADPAVPPRPGAW